ncbi:uncharacterized protein K444DRAFT_172885 [Hyaloscypha bicolor E]|uniref:Uncharacterized protein n=1 Tax=Hyaloscypha bicolor E TaxID=1095630 RepID=A0A2J6SRB0_9HELO|nr:uncharacterized protein K444DRAFT_172885 [Hyaloscypha bicolor E]PMD53318.1 hypothetical protein K444DRAFT_172885 [Hyaloscypha bicolor E]
MMPENRRGTQSFSHLQHATTLSKNILTISNWLISRRRSRHRRYRLVIASNIPAQVVSSKASTAVNFCPSAFSLHAAKQSLEPFLSTWSAASKNSPTSAPSAVSPI